MENNFGHQLDHIFRKIAQQELCAGNINAFKDQEILKKIEEFFKSQAGKRMIQSEISEKEIEKTIVFVNRLFQLKEDFLFYELYNMLDKEFKLNWNISDLEAVFLNKGKFSGNPFKWPKELKTKNFSYLIGSLGEVKNIDDPKDKVIFFRSPNTHYWEYICKYFCDYNDHPFKPRSLNTLYSRLEGDVILKKKVDKIISSIISKINH